MKLPSLEKLILIDIETVSQHESFEKMPENWQHLWEEKTKWQWGAEDDAASFYHQRAAILAEFGKIVCISVGYFKVTEGELQLRLKSFAGTNELEILKTFVLTISQFVNARRQPLEFAGHNIKEFDIPYLCRRLLINEMMPPDWLDFQHLKPWEVPLLDTMHLWRFGDYKNYTSLNLLSAVLGIATPKDDMDGSMVGEVYWKDQDLARIATYCQKDVCTVAQLLLRLSGKPLLKDSQMVSANG